MGHREAQPKIPCPVCGHAFSVVYPREQMLVDNELIRWRECKLCHSRWETAERAVRVVRRCEVA